MKASLQPGKSFGSVASSAPVQGKGGLKTIVDNRPSTITQRKLQGVVQRVIVDSKDKSKVIIDKFNSSKEAVQIVTAYIFSDRYKNNRHALMPAFDELFNVVESIFNDKISDKIMSEESFSIAQIAEYVTNAAHEKWLASDNRKKANLPSHEEIQSQSLYFLEHYNLFDKNMIWRWTSTPSTEQVYTAKRSDDETDISCEYIADIIAKHSGGNDKTNPYIKTLSFGRNPAALMGVAASKGGDKHVLNIIDKAEYLYGININSLPSKGITAHAACARMISLFESEYVLINTPGFPSYSLDELATVKYRNPFKGNAINEMLNESEKNSMKVIENEMGFIKPEIIPEAINEDFEFSKQILANAKNARGAATMLSGLVQDKEPLNGKAAEAALNQFNKNAKFKIQGRPIVH